MQRLLLIHVMLWSLVCAIPAQDMSLIKQAQQLTENAYKTIMQNTLQIANYRAQQIIACNAVRADEIDWWQNWIDLPKVEKRNLTEDEIQQLDDGPGNDEMLNNPYMPRDAIEQRLNECTNNTYKEKLSRSFQKAEDYLKIFEHEVSLKLRDVSNETRQFDKNMFKAFNEFLNAKHGERETLFKRFRTKIIRYEDRLLINDVRKLAEHITLQLRENELQLDLYMARSIMECMAVNQTEIGILQNLVNGVNDKNQSLTEDEYIAFKRVFHQDVLHFNVENMQQITDILDKCKNGEPSVVAKSYMNRVFEYLKTFKNETSSKMQSVSKATRQANVNLFEFYEKSDNVYYFLLTVDQLDDF